MEDPEPTQAYPEPIVGALVIDSQERLLLVRSHKWRDQYGLPGGHLELGERLEQAVVREVKEETDLNVSQPRFLFFQEMVFDEEFWMKSHFIFFEFVCRTESTDVHLNSEAEEHRWIDPAEALDLDLDSYTRKAILEFLRSRGNEIVNSRGDR